MLTVLMVVLRSEVVAVWKAAVMTADESDRPPTRDETRRDDSVDLELDVSKVDCEGGGQCRTGRARI